MTPDILINFFLEKVTKEDVEALRTKTLTWAHEEKHLRKLVGTKEREGLGGAVEKNATHWVNSRALFLHIPDFESCSTSLKSIEPFVREVASLAASSTNIRFSKAECNGALKKWPPDYADTFSFPKKSGAFRPTPDSSKIVFYKLLNIVCPVVAESHYQMR